MHKDLLMKTMQSALKVCIAPCVPSLGLSMGCWIVQGQIPPPSRGGMVDCRKNFKFMQLSNLWYHWREEFWISAFRGAMKYASRGTKLKIWFRNNLRAKPGW